MPSKPSPQSVSLWTRPERDAILREFTPKEPFPAVYARLKQTAGPPLPSIDTVRHRAFRVLGLPRYFPPIRPLPRNSFATVSDPRSLAPMQRIPVTLPRLIVEAAELGIEARDWDDLRRVNDRADRMGLPGFQRKMVGGGRRGR